MAARSDVRWSRRAWCAAGGLLALGCRDNRSAGVAVATAPDPGPTRIAFGSCCDQRRPAPIWRAIVDRRPELFLFIGDNVYADAEDEAGLRAAYDALGRSPGYAELVASTPVLAVWDDHDYGRNDAGKEYPLRDASQRIMLDFFGEPADSARRGRPGVYLSTTMGPAGRRVQIVLLDTRYFRDALVPTEPGGARYRPNPDPTATVLGEAQWRWLEQCLREPAELRLVVSSIQVIADEHPFESWGLFPHERARLLAILGRTDGVIVLSGDRHRAELSRCEAQGLAYPLLDLTSSSLNLPLRGTDPNRYRVGPLVESENFGWIEVDWERRRVVLELVGLDGVAAMTHAVELDALAAT